MTRARSLAPICAKGARAHSRAPSKRLLPSPALVGVSAPSGQAENPRADRRTERTFPAARPRLPARMIESGRLWLARPRDRSGGPSAAARAWPCLRSDRVLEPYFASVASRRETPFKLGPRRRPPPPNLAWPDPNCRAQPNRSEAARRAANSRVTPSWPASSRPSKFGARRCGPAQH